LPFSGVSFDVAYPAENAESFLDGHLRAFEFFGGAPRRLVYDNPAYAVKRAKGRIKGRSRDLTDGFAELRSTFLFEAAFAAPAKGNEKGAVESKVKAARSASFVPVPQVASFEELNEILLARALAAKEKSECFAEDAARLLPQGGKERLLVSCSFCQT
jgi:transposase